MAARAGVSEVVEMIRCMETIQELEHLAEGWSGADIRRLAARSGFAFDSNGTPSHVGVAKASQALGEWENGQHARQVEQRAPFPGNVPEIAGGIVQAADEPEPEPARAPRGCPTCGTKRRNMHPVVDQRIAVCADEWHQGTPEGARQYERLVQAYGQPVRSAIPNDEVDSTTDPTLADGAKVIDLLAPLEAGACPKCRAQMIGRPRQCAEHGLPDYDDLVDAWHRGAGALLPLHEYLGMTWDEYGAWASPDALPVCKHCDGLIEYHDPTGDGLAAFWSHAAHPADGHDAEPKVIGSTEGIDGPVLSPSGDETEDGSAYVECTTHSCEHRYEQDCEDAIAGDPLVSTACAPLEVAELASSTTPTPVDDPDLDPRRQEYAARVLDGWVPFGTHVDAPQGVLDFDGCTEDEDGLPAWERLVGNRHMMERLLAYCEARGIPVPVTDRCDQPVEEAQELQEAWMRWQRESTVDAFRHLQHEIADSVLAATVVAFSAQTTVEECLVVKTEYDRHRAKREALEARHVQELVEMQQRHSEERRALAAAGLV